ncbi:hypothetical protein WA158_001236 [Blastocystis sp. Blastoise]
MGNTLTTDDFNCIGGENWYKQRCSKNFLIEVTSNLFTDTCSLLNLFRSNESIKFSRIQNIRLSEHIRKDYFENVRNMMYKSSSGILQAEDTLALETADLQELSLLVNTTSSYEELFVRRNAILIFMHRILRSAQIHGASLRPAFPDSSTFCTCSHLPHFEYCPMKDVSDTEKNFLFLPLTKGARVKRGPDWQWNNQDGGSGGLGTVTLIKDWKGVPGQGVKVLWDATEDDNTYRYGADSCYDVVLANPVFHKDYIPLMGIDYPSETYWSKYIHSYVRNGVYKSGSPFASRISKTKLISMLPDYQEDPIYKQAFVDEACVVIQEVLEYALMDTQEFFSMDKHKFRQFRPNKYSIIVRDTVLFPFQIYLFSQVQDDINFDRMETHILEYYLDKLFDISQQYIRFALQLLQSNNEHVLDILYALKESVFGSLMPFICTCLYVGCLPDEVTREFRSDIETVISLWTTFLKEAHLTEGGLPKNVLNLYSPVLSDSCYSDAHPSTQWFISILNLLVAAYSRCVPGFTPPVNVKKSSEALVEAWGKSYIFSGGIIEDDDVIPNHENLLSYYDSSNDTIKLFMKWIDCKNPEPLYKRKLIVYPELESKLFVVLIYMCNLFPLFETILSKLKEGDITKVDCPEVLTTLYQCILNIRDLLRAKKQAFSQQSSVMTFTRSQTLSYDPTNHSGSSPIPRNSSRTSIQSPKDIIDTKQTQFKTDTHLVTDVPSSTITHSITPPISGRNTPKIIFDIPIKGPKASPPPLYSQHPSTSITPSSTPSSTPTPIASSTCTPTPNTNNSNNITIHHDGHTLKHTSSLRRVSSQFNNETYHPPTNVSNTNIPETQIEKPNYIRSLTSTSETSTILQDSDYVYEDYFTDPSLFPTDYHSLNDLICDYIKKLDFLMQVRPPVDVTDMKYSYEYTTHSSKNQTQRNTYLTPRDEDVDEDNKLPSTLMETTIDCIKAFLIHSQGINAQIIFDHLLERKAAALDRGKAVDNAISFLQTLEDFPQASRFYLLGIHNALTTTPNFHSSRTPRSIFSTFVSTEHEVLLTDFLSNMQGVGIKYLTLVYDKIKEFCEYLKTLFERTIDKLDWRLGCTVLWILNCDYNTIASYLPFELEFPHFFQLMTDRLIQRYKEDYGIEGSILISAGPLWDHMVDHSYKSITLFKDNLHNNEQNENINDYTMLQGCFPTCIFALANGLRISYDLLLVRQFYEKEWKLKRTPAREENSISNWSFEDVWMLFADETPQYIQCTCGVFHEFMMYIKRLYNIFKDRCQNWIPYENDNKQNEKGCNKHTCIKVYTSNNIVRSELTDMFVSAGESLLSYYFATVTWILDTSYGEYIDWKYYGDIIWDLLYTSPRLRKMSLICLQSILPFTSYIPSVIHESSLYRIEPITCGLISSSSSPSPSPSPSISLTNIQEQYSLVIYLLHMCVHDDFCYGAMSEERLSCTSCCSFFPYLYKQVYDTITEKFPDLFMDCISPFSPELDTNIHKYHQRCKMLIRTSGYGASYTNLCVSDEVVYLLRLMMSSSRWREPISNVFEIVLEKASEKILAEKKIILARMNTSSDNNNTNLSPDSPPKHLYDTNEEEEEYIESGGNNNEEEERERTVWYSMASGTLKVLGSLSRRMYSGCKVRVHQNIMNSGNDIDSLLLSIYQSNGNGYVINYSSSMGEALVLLDQINIPKYFSIYHLEVVDKHLPQWDILPEFSSKFFKYIERIIINLEYNDSLFEIPTDSSKPRSPIKLVELQNLVLEQHAIQSLHQFILRNPLSVTSLSPEFVQFIFQFSLHPSPARGIFDTVFIRFCFNHLAEQLVDTYPNCARLLYQGSEDTKETPSQNRATSPTTNGSTTVPSKNPYLRNVGITSSCTSTMKTAATTDDIKTIKILERYEPVRWENAKRVSDVVELPPSITYKILRIHQDDVNATINFVVDKVKILKQYIETDKKPIDINLDMKADDRAILSDIDNQTNVSLLTPMKSSTASKSFLNTRSVPYFVRFQPLSTCKVPNITNVIASKYTGTTDVLTPVTPTGVIEKVLDNNTVILSVLNANSGLCERVYLQKQEVGLHKFRFGNYFSSMSTLREFTGRICLIYNLRLLREFLVTLTHYLQKQRIDILQEYKLQPNELLIFFKLMHVFSTATLSRSIMPSEVTLTPSSSLIFIYKNTLANLITTSIYGKDILKCLMSSCWTSFPYNNSVLRQQNTDIYYVSSLHPYFKKCKYHDKMIFPKAQALRILFDKKCDLELDKSYLAFYQDPEYTQLIARYTGNSSRFLPLFIRGNTVYYTFEAQQEAANYWGYAFCVQPLEGITWNQDITAINSQCFDWVCYLFDFLLDVGLEYKYPFEDTDYWQIVLENMIHYLRTFGAPYKLRITELLIKLLSSPDIFVIHQLPSVKTLEDIVLSYCDKIDNNTIMPTQFSQLLELFMIMRLNNQLPSLETPDSDNIPIDPFPVLPKETTNDLTSALQAVHILGRCLYYNSRVPNEYIKQICRICRIGWNQESYNDVILTLREFNTSHDILLIDILTQHCKNTKIDPLEFSVPEFYLSQDDLVRHFILKQFTPYELRIRIGLLLLFNINLDRSMSLIDLMHIFQENRLGSILCKLSGCILPAIKENVLDLSIKQTIYDSKDPRPIVVLDNRRIYNEFAMDSTSQQAPILYNEYSTRNALTSQCIFAQMYREMKKINMNMLRAPLDKKDRLLAVKYEGEQGLDWGGIYRDAIERCIEDLFSTRFDLFVPCPNSSNEEGMNTEKYVPNPKYKNSSEAMDMYSFVGNIIGISIRTKQQLAMELPSIVWKYIVGVPIGLEDIQAIDSQFIKTLSDLKKYMQENYPQFKRESSIGIDPCLDYKTKGDKRNSLRVSATVTENAISMKKENEEEEEEEEDAFEEEQEGVFDIFGLYFTVKDLAGNEVELLPGGKNLPVTEHNTYKYIELCEDFRINEVKQASEAIAYGVRSLVPQRALALFTWYQLERYVCGEPEISIDELRKHTQYVGWTESHEVVRRFWKVFGDLSHKDRSQFLRFVWGRSRLPHSVDWPRPFKLTAKSAGNDQLPVAHTCFFQLELPQYTTEAILKERLLVAIHFGTGEFIIR